MRHIANDKIIDTIQDNTLKLHFTQNEYTCGWYVTDDNYEYTTDTGTSPSGSGATKCNALLSYFYNAGFDPEINYEFED